MTTFKSIDEVELAFHQIIDQFRQIDDKYGLMIDRYINDVYVGQRDKILNDYSKLATIKKEYLHREEIGDNKIRQLRQLDEAVIR